MRGRTLRILMTVLVAALAVALTVMIAGCGDDEPETSESASGAATGEPIKVGAIVSTSGTYAGLGQPEQNALEMEVARINDAGGVGGRPIEVIYEDDATDEAKAVAAASKLIEQDEVIAIIGATGTGQTMATRGEVQRAGIPQVSMAGGTVVTDPVDALVFATPWSNNIVVPFTLVHLKEQGITKIGLISDSGGFGKDGKAVLEAEAPDTGVKIVANQTFNPGDTDMTAQLTKIKNSDAEAIVMWTAGSEAAIIAKNNTALDTGLPIYGSHGIARQEFIDGAGEAGEGVNFAAGKILLPETYGEDTEAYAVATDFTDRYEKAYGEAPSTFAGHAYDALYLIVGAARNIEGDLTPEALRDELEETAGMIGIGGTFNMDDEDHNGLNETDLNMYVIKDGAWQQVE